MAVWMFDRVTVVDVYDGDTFRAEIDLGLDLVRRKIRVRLANASAPELAESGGATARDWLAARLKPGVQVVCASTHWDRYANRIDAIVNVPGDDTDLGTAAIAAGVAKPYH